MVKDLRAYVSQTPNSSNSSASSQQAYREFTGRMSLDSARRSRILWHSGVRQQDLTRRKAGCNQRPTVGTESGHRKSQIPFNWCFAIVVWCLRDCSHLRTRTSSSNPTPNHQPKPTQTSYLNICRLQPKPNPF